MINAAITGNIGSGKSTVTKIFQSLGVPVFIADAEAKALYEEEDVKQAISALFGQGIFDKNKDVDKKKLANIIFNDKTALQNINKLIHPLTLAKYQQWLKKHQQSPYTLHESAILFENNLQDHFKATLFVNASEKLRIERVMKRDGVSSEHVLERIKNQWPDDKKVELADFVINNDGKTFLIPQVLELDKILKLL